MKAHIGPPLYHATCQAMEVFKRNFAPRCFPLLHVDTVDRDAFIADWAARLTGVTHEAIPEAARRWIGDPEKLNAKGQVAIPNAAAFALYAKKVDIEQFRPQHQPAARKPSHSEKNLAQHLSNRARETLGSIALVSEVWRVLLDACVNDEQREQVRRGYVAMEQFDAAVDIVRQSARIAI